MTKEWPETRWTAIGAEAFAESAVDLAEAVTWLSREGAAYECWLVEWGNAAPFLILFVPTQRRAGINWGGPPTLTEWTDCDSAHEALRRYLAGETTP